MKPARVALRVALFFPLALALAAGACAAQDKPLPPMTDQERIDALIRQNQQLVAEVARLAARPATREETFAMCMQAARGQSGAMAVESIGSHCAALLKQPDGGKAQ